MSLQINHRTGAGAHLSPHVLVTWRADQGEADEEDVRLRV